MAWVISSEYAPIMARGEKLLESMRNNPRDWRIEDVAIVCRTFGLECEPPSGGGAHWKVRDVKGERTLIVPAHKPVNHVYIRKLVALLETG